MSQKSNAYRRDQFLSVAASLNTIDLIKLYFYGLWLLAGQELEELMERHRAYVIMLLLIFDSGLVLALVTSH